MRMREELKFFLPAALFLCIMLFLFWGKLGFFFIDISREVYIPYAMNEGGVLYKDIFNVYAPLGYQLNALITSIFRGGGLSVFYFAGFINAFLIISALYLISRLFLSGKTSAVLCIFSIAACVFSNSAANYIFPYSYSMVYSLNVFLWMLYALLCYVKSGDKRFLYFSCAAFGACAAFKYEFMLSALVLLYFVFKDTDLKTKALAAAAFSAVPLLSLLCLALQGADLNNLHQSFNYMLMLSNAESVKHVYAFLGFIPSAAFAKILFSNLIYCIIYTGIISLPLFLYNRFKGSLKGAGRAVFNVFLAALLCLITVSGLLFYKNSVFLFSWMGLAAIFAAAFYIVKRRFKLNAEEKIYFILLITSILAAAKCIFNLSFNTYGNYYLPLFILCLSVFIIHFAPEAKKSAAEKYVFFFFAFLSVFAALSNYSGAQIYHNARIETEKGVIYIQDIYTDVINRVISFIKAETKEKDRVLVVPDGAFINYLAGRKSDNKYYSLTPPNVEIFSAEKIIRDLKNNPPEYIVIQPVMYKDYGVLSFCRSFGGDVCSFIYENYAQTEVFTDEKSKFNMSIWKKN